MWSPVLLAALAAALCCGLTPRGDTGGRRWPGACDDGKLFVDEDLPGDAVWACPVAAWPESTQSYPGVDTVYDPEPAQQVCMGQPISYNLTIPNSGPYRPMGAESGEYLYCPPQRWLNNLHHGATVLLYHPCAPLSEHVRLSVLARSCLSDYVITPHPQLEDKRVALVSWGRTLELSTGLTSSVCDWLESVAAAVAGINPDDVVATRKYSLLLIRPAEQHAVLAKQAHADTMQSVRRCCEQSLFTPPDRGDEARRRGGGRGGRRGRQRREDIKKQEKSETMTHHESSPSTSSQTSRASRTSESNPGPRKPGPEPPQPGLGGHPDPTLLGSLLAITTMAGPHGSDPGKVTRSANEGKSRGVVKQTDKGSAGQNSAEQKTSTGVRGGREKNGARLDVKQRQLDRKHTHAVSGEGKKIETPAAPPHPNPYRAVPGRTPATAAAPTASGDRVDPDGRDAAPGKAGVPGGKGRTPRTDQAAWAAGALGFLLVLLALSVLHTRLYRQWRTTPSMYWHDPRRDYDSVADVIRRRLRIAEKRPRRKSQPRRQECVLLPSSDEEDDDDDW
ncbi:unnamed protein product [Merluccius merluccius]